MYMVSLMIMPMITTMNIILISSHEISKLKKTSLTWSFILVMNFLLMTLCHNELMGFQHTVVLKWFTKLNLTLNWGFTLFSLDGVSLFFMGLSMMLIPICMMMSWSSMTHLSKEFLISLHIILLLLMGVFLVLDLLGFYILFEGMLIPMFMMMGVWGSSEEKMKAAFYFFFYTLMGSLLMLISMFKMYAMFGITNYQNLALMEIPMSLQYWLFLGFFASLAVKMPMMPTHIWLPQAHVEAPMAGSVMLAGMLLKLGGYGFMSFSYPLFPMASEYFSPMMMTMSIMAMMYGSFSTCRQTDMKSLIAYSSIAHMGLVTLSMFMHSMEGLISALMMMMAHGLVSPSLFMVTAVMYMSHHSSAMKYFSGLAMTMPMFSMMTFILMLANIGFPLTFNFIAEFFSILTSFNHSFMMGILVCLGTILSTIYALYFYNSMYFGSLSPHLTLSSEINNYEFQGFLPLITLTIILGLLPNSMMKFLMTSSYMNISL